MVKKFLSRKFIFGVIPLITICIALILKVIDFTQFCIAIPIVLGLYLPANIAAKVVENDRILTGEKREE